MAPLAINILRAVQAILAVIVLGTGAYFVNLIVGSYSDCSFDYCYDIHVRAPSQLAFILFDACWSILAVLLLGLTPIFLPKLAHPIIIAALDAFTMLVWFAGAIALSVFTGAYSIGGAYAVLQACVAFAWFSWAAFLATMVLNILAITKGTSNSARHHKEENSANPELQHATV
ncbi:MAG: hypothetical protein MMC23_007564 [Stictis urceolatum]|nr:hypothetical protein [Stictis urceolata]